MAAVTIRAVAARLGVAPMTLYGHVAGADELVDLVVGATIAVAVAKQPKRYRDGRGALLGASPTGCAACSSSIRQSSTRTGGDRSRTRPEWR